MKNLVLLAVVSAMAIRMEENDEVLVEDVDEATPSVRPPPQPPVERIPGEREEAKVKETSKILRKYQNVKDITKYEILAMESFGLIKELQDIIDASTFADGNVMLELHRKSDEISRIGNELQQEFQRMSLSEQKGVMAEYKQLLFNNLPQRLRHFKELSAGHLSLHRRIMESTLDVLEHNKQHSGLVNYIHSRLRHGQFSAEKKIREMLSVQQKTRNKWIFGITRIEWIMLTVQVWLLSAAFGALWWVLGGLKIGSRASLRSGWIFEASLFASIAGLVHVEMTKYFIDWSFLRTRTLCMSVVQFLLACILREARKQCVFSFGGSKKIAKPAAHK
ncbi:branched-chain amino acid uptake carrier [Perkinsela sp. CCAP 1560/4]|nr:branched-chain amino acid uptake carrier [Perkinsela sp. CCAP 1560/4]|eukprot:KNH08078.1 branched-chain amino acid uptake carrier [Perkinsela sp. CCAP 1560/4]